MIIKKENTEQRKLEAQHGGLIVVTQIITVTPKLYSPQNKSPSSYEQHQS